MITEIKAYKTSDGHIFETKDLATIHEEESNVKIWYEGNKLHEIPYEEMIRWIVRNIEAIVSFMPFLRAKQCVSLGKPQMEN